MKSVLPPLLLAASIGITSVAHAQDLDERTICVYDPVGRTGTVFTTAKKLAAAAVEKGVRVELKPYTDEGLAANDLTAGKCDGSLLTGVRSKLFNPRSYTIEAMGALSDPSYRLLKTTLRLLSKDGAAKYMQHGDYEVAGVFPAGAVYLYVRNQEWDSIQDLSGKSVATLDFDKSARVMVEKVGASMVPAEIATFAGMFNNGSVDIIYAPATAYSALELENGLSAEGGAVIDYPLAQLTLQLILRTDPLPDGTQRFPEGFGQWGRDWAYHQFDTVLASVQKEEGKVKSSPYWRTIPETDKPGYDSLFREVRSQLGTEGTYDATILKLMKRVRCGADKARAECVMDTEGGPVSG